MSHSPDGVRTADIDITDLLRPERTEAQKQILEATEAVPLDLTVEAVLEAARKATGLSDFGADDFHPRLALWLQVTREEENLTQLSRIGLFTDFVRWASNRLLIEDLVKGHPQILEIPIDRPVVIAGLPRSGTTHLQSFLAADKRLRSMPYWEAMSPVPLPDQEPKPGHEDARRLRASAEWAQMDALLPHIKSMHEFSPDHISEDIELQNNNFSSYYLEWQVLAPQWQQYYFAHDQTDTYRYLKKGLQVMTWLKGPNRWLLKCPQHMEQLRPLTTVFPDATVVITHRDPVASVQSAITTICYAARIRQHHVQAQRTADYWIDRYEKLLRRCVRDHDELDPAKTVDVYFDKLVAEPWIVLQEIYRKADLPLSAQVRSEMQAFLEANPRGKHGQVIYNLRRDFGIAPQEVRRHYQFYMQRFPVKVEVK
jgi:hypothetical protein